MIHAPHERGCAAGALVNATAPRVTHVDLGGRWPLDRQGLSRQVLR